MHHRTQVWFLVALTGALSASWAQASCPYDPRNPTRFDLMEGLPAYPYAWSTDYFSPNKGKKPRRIYPSFEFWMSITSRGSRVNTQAEYLQELQKFLTWLWRPEILMEGLKVCPHEMQEFWRVLAVGLGVEASWRERWLKDSSLRKPSQGVMLFASFPNFKALFPRGTEQLAQDTIIGEWVRLFRNVVTMVKDRAAVFAIFRRGIDQCSAERCQLASQNLNNVVQELGRDKIHGSDALAYFPLKLTTRDLNAIRMSALAAHMLTTNPAELDGWIRDRVGDCKVESMELYLKVLGVAEDALRERAQRWYADAKKKMNPKYRNSRFLKGPKDLDLIPVYRAFMKAVDKCENAYSLLKLLGKHYSSSDYSLSWEFQRDLLAVAKEAYRRNPPAPESKVEAIEVGEVERFLSGKNFGARFKAALIGLAFGESWHTRMSPRELELMRWMHYYGLDDGYTMGLKGTGWGISESLKGDFNGDRIILRFQAAGRHVRVTPAGKGVRGGRFGVTCDDAGACVLRFTLLLPSSVQWKSICDLTQVTHRDGLERLQCVTFDQSGELKGMSLLDEDN